MKANRKLSGAVAAVLGAHAAQAAAQAAPPAAETPASGALQEVLVTANRRVENLQDVPITIQALTAETLSQLNVQTFDDFLKYLPNVTATTFGPAQGDINMRGLSTGGSGGTQGFGATGSFPNVAVYLDEQSGEVPGRNLDIYAVDLERIEVLEGPQGTLFGAGAEAGVVRYITNKPKLNVTEAAVNAGYATTAHGDPSAAADAVINLPLIADRLAARLVIYDDRRGGYIDNIPATFAREPTDRVVVNYFGGVVPPNSGPINNFNNAGKAINPVTYQGVRASVLWQINDAWKALITQSYQSIDAEGVFWAEQYDSLANPLPDLSVQLFGPSYDKDKFENTAWTLEGRVSGLRLVYAGAFLSRTADQLQDYTNYSRGTYAGYYQCNYPGYPFINGVPTPGSAGFCYSPRTFWTDHETTTHQSHELRVSTPDDWRLRGLVGLFWEQYRVHENTDWHYGTSPNFYPIGPPSINPYGAQPTNYPVTSNNPNVRPLGDAFFDDVTRGYQQLAAFASVDFDIIPKVLTITGGTRWYDTRNFELGSNVGSFGCEIYGPYDGYVPPNPCVSTLATGVLSNLNNLDAKHLRNSYVGTRSRANLTWHVTPDVMAYYTWSQGFRPGGFNRAQAQISPNSPLFGIWAPPISYAPDTLTNNEIGWKTEWLDHHLQWNGAVYQENWDNVQLSIFDPSVTGNLVFTTNGPNYRVRGAETQLVWRAAAGLTVTGAAAWNSSENVHNLTLLDKNGQPITNVVNPFGQLGAPLAQSPPFEGNLRARYDWRVRDYDAFVQVGTTHQAHSYATTNPQQTTFQGVPTNFNDPSFTTYDASAGVGSGPWLAQLYAENLTDTRAILYSSYAEFVKMNTVNRPRTVGVRVSYKLEGK
ncbi:MAG TPA: TonB-dependent receptor [Steroidobacteraceae bacterium]|nr:TonB-dependent receptor [Steroidobacteraceae bacterium]